MGAITNVAWDDAVITGRIEERLKVRDALRARLGAKVPGKLPDCATWTPGGREEILAEAVSNDLRITATRNEDVRSLRQLLIIGCNTVILTAGCAKYRYNKLHLGNIGGIPRVLDAGQCNDSYSLAVIAMKVKEAFGLKDINDLPVSYDIAWYEQKAVAVLLALLYLGVKGIRLGPTLPASLSPGVAQILVDRFNIRPIGSVEGDIEAMLAGD